MCCQLQDGRGTLLEFVLKTYCQVYENEVDIGCPTRFRLPEPSNMRHAAQVTVISLSYNQTIPGRVVQSVTCLATDASLTADPEVASSITARSNTFLDIDHEIISTVTLIPSAESFKKGCCQLQAKVCARSTG